MNETVAPWGREIVVERAGGGVPYRLYEPRTRRVASLLDHAERWAGRTHVVQGDVRLDFGELQGVVRRKAAQLRQHGIGPGDRVALLGWNGPDWVVNVWAAWWLGAVPVLLNSWWSTREIEHAFELLRPRAVLADARLARKLPAGTATAPWSTPTTVDGPLPDHAEGDDENEAALILFTSGSTGFPKAVVLSHRSIISGLHALLAVTKRLPQDLGDAPTSVALHTAPLFHVGGVQTLVRSVVVGETLVFPEGRFDPEAAMDLIAAHGVTRWSAVPTMVGRLLDAQARRPVDLGSLRSLTLGAAPAHPTLYQRIRDELPSVRARIATGYGLTENGGQASAASGRDTRDRPGVCGIPLPTVEITFGERTAGGDGEVLIRAASQMLGYFGESNGPIDAEGWLHTGDLGHLDEDGYLWVTGRSKDLILRGGENIAPLAVERALVGVDGVLDAAVLGLPHPDLGEEVAAVVVVDEATADRPDLDDYVSGALRSVLASFAVPTRWRFQTQELPVLGSEKVDKHALAAELTAEEPSVADRATTAS
ncbi:MULTISPECIES: class I adenylate-forming enzyme family protein [unclassified Streptomyces]|uniref:class I adenylate-forming enzyme family protein n=1 Tax=unclassified Streptomyces TaxID=2593676 RepID=UPI002E17FDB8|nr:MULTISPECIES: class I adenylate-forming enzyme family protein [unclassified Streptomyces]